MYSKKGVSHRHGYQIGIARKYPKNLIMAAQSAASLTVDMGGWGLISGGDIMNISLYYCIQGGMQ
jgi:hypothetical protein